MPDLVAVPYYACAAAALLAVAVTPVLLGLAAVRRHEASAARRAARASTVGTISCAGLWLSAPLMDEPITAASFLLAAVFGVCWLITSTEAAKRSQQSTPAAEETPVDEQA